jgi:hypothetical protein
MRAPDLQYCIAAMASLDEPVRRELYLYVAGPRIRSVSCVVAQSLA